MSVPPVSVPQLKLQLLGDENLAGGGQGQQTEVLATPPQERHRKAPRTTPAPPAEDAHHALGCILELCIVPDLLQLFLSLLPPDLLLLEGGQARKETPAEVPNHALLEESGAQPRASIHGAGRFFRGLQHP